MHKHNIDGVNGSLIIEISKYYEYRLTYLSPSFNKNILSILFLYSHPWLILSILKQTLDVTSFISKLFFNALSP